MLSSLYLIPRQVIVLPIADETINTNISKLNAQKKSMSATQAAFIFGQSAFSSLLVVICLSTARVNCAMKNVTGTAIKSINNKLIYRHPHVFGSVKVKDADEVLVNWEALKKQERKKDASMLEGVPRDMPALAYSWDIQERVARVGFDWDDDEGVIDKLAEEVREFKQAQSKEQSEGEFGDLLFTLVNIARRQNINLETALRQTNRRFYKRFACMEELCRKRGLNFAELSFDEQNKLWEEAKKVEG